jgi:hypothetical protein
VGNNKVVTIAVGAVAAVFALSLIMRFVLLSQYGLSGGWIFLGLPFGGIGVLVLLLRLGIINGGSRSRGTGSAWGHYDIGGQAPSAPRAAFAPVPTVSQSLQELDRIHASGAISDAEYSARRRQILSTL